MKNILKEAIKIAINKAKITIKQLAEMLDYSTSKGNYLYKFLRKNEIKRKPLKIIRTIAKIFKLDYEEILNYINNNQAKKLASLLASAITKKLNKKVVAKYEAIGSEEEIIKRLKEYAIKKDLINKIKTIIYIKKILSKAKKFKVLIYLYLIKNKKIEATAKVFIKK